MTAVAVIYPYVPHYRMPVFRQMSVAGLGYRYTFFAGRNTIDTSVRSETASTAIDLRLVRTTTHRGLTWQSGLLRACVGGEFRHLVFLGDPHFLSTWLYALVARLRGKRVWFWTHGWLRPETGPRGFVRRAFYRLAHGLLVYGDRARQIGRSAGFREDRIVPIYNSLDYELQRAVREHCLAQDLAFGADGDLLQGLEEPFIACVARLTAACRFDLAIEALALLRERGGPRVPVVLIGEGPVRASLAALAAARGVECRFLGELYDEERIGPVLLRARAVVSPGKVGLTAMHALAYGTPVITHGDFDRQGPECEAITSGQTGDFFRVGDAADLSATIERWLDKPRTAAERGACWGVIEARYTPARQCELIASALRSLEA
jgi:glycosyltransferase involved in cell wall biosynthesis